MAKAGAVLKAGAVVADVEGHGPPVLLLHGQPGRAADWAAVRRLLSPSFLVVAPDRPGWGRTGGRAGDFADNAAAAAALLDRLEVDRATVVGHSWGGGVALEMAGRYPDRVAGLVLVASVAPGDAIGLVDRALALRPLGDVASLATLGIAARALSVPTLRRRVDGLLPTGWRHTFAQDSPDLDAWRSFAVEQRAFVGQIDAMADHLADIAAPTLVLAGTADRVVGPRAAALLASAIPGSVLRLVAGAGHALHWDHPDRVAAAVVDITALAS